MILTVLGGSAHSTPVLADALTKAAPEAPWTIRLAGRSRARLAAVARACDVLRRRGAAMTEVYGEGDWPEAIEGSDVVLIQVRIGGYEGREFDESFPLPFGVPGDEGLGPGGLSAAYRAWPEMRLLFTEIRERAPRAEVILLTSPSSLLIRLAEREFPGWPLVGTCELPLTTLRHLCSACGVRDDEVEFGYTGVNHLGFLHDVHCKGVGGGEDLLATYATHAGGSSFPSADLAGRLRAFPLKYLRLHYEREQVVQEQRMRAGSRAQELAAIAEQSFEAFRAGDELTIRRALRARCADWYADAVVPLLLPAIDREVARPVFLTLAEKSGEVRERAYRVGRGGRICVPDKGRVSDEASDVVAAFSAYERAAAEAVLLGTEEALAWALALHPWVDAGHERELARLIVDQPFCRAAPERGQVCRV